MSTSGGLRGSGIEVKSVDVVVPVFNEEANVDALLGRCVEALSKTSYKYRILLVDDGSRDGTVAKIMSWIDCHPDQVALVRLNRNYGQHAAIIAGFERCTADAVVTIDADLQNPPEEISRLLDKMREGFDVVGSVRQGRKDTLLRKVPSLCMNFLVRRLTRVEMRDFGCMLRAYHIGIVKAILSCSERFIYIPVLANSFARSAVEIDVGHSDRAAGESKYNYWKLFALFFDILTGSTFMPLRILTFAGVALSVASVFFGLFLIVLRLCFGAAWAVFGVFTLFGVLFFFLGIQFLAFGLLGEYICRIGMDVRRRPKYLVAWEDGAGFQSRPSNAPAASDAAI